MTITDISSNSTTVEEKPKAAYDSVFQYNKELRAENLELKIRLALLEKEIQLLLPAAHFLRTREALHETLKQYAGLAEAVRTYRMNPKKTNIEYILNALKKIEEKK